LGKKHKEGTVFEALMEVVKDLNCSGILFENVENLTGERHKATFEEMKLRLGKEFEFTCEKLSPDQIGIPQHRQRWFIFGIRRKKGLKGYESERLKSLITDAIEDAREEPINLKRDILTPGQMGKGQKITKVELKALTAWDTYMHWLAQYPEIGGTPSPFWGMEMLYDYSIDDIQEALKNRGGKALRSTTLAELTYPNVSSSNAKKKAREYKKKTGHSVVRNLPPYLWDLDTRKEPYPDWKVTYISNSNEHIRQIKAELKANGKSREFTAWKKAIEALDPTFQKFEWHIKERPLHSKKTTVERRLKHRLEGRLIQFRPSGIRVSKGTRHPALVAIGQVPVVGTYLKRPRWQTLAQLQSIPPDFVRRNDALFGATSQSGASGEPIKRLGNAVNVGLVRCLAEVLRGQLPK
jgi:DNA (cytosine-5)-methyltransferase 1